TADQVGGRCGGSSGRGLFGLGAAGDVGGGFAQQEQHQRNPEEHTEAQGDVDGEQNGGGDDDGGGLCDTECPGACVACGLFGVGGGHGQDLPGAQTTAFPSGVEDRESTRLNSSHASLS